MAKQVYVSWGKRISVSDAAWFLGVSSGTVRKLILGRYLKEYNGWLDKTEVKKLAPRIFLGIGRARGNRVYFIFDEKGKPHIF